MLRMLPLALLVLLAMALPTNIGGWGPREGVAAWAFGAAGLGADRGVATAVVYGVMVLVASLPGAVVLVAAWLRRSVRPPEPVGPGAACPDPRGAADALTVPYTLLSCSMSIDGYLGSGGAKRLAALQRRRLRPGRRGPRLVRRDPGRRGDRARSTTPGCWCARRPGATSATARGSAAVADEGDRHRAARELDACADFFTAGDTEKLVYCASPAVADARDAARPGRDRRRRRRAGRDAHGSARISPRAACSG